MAWWSGDYLALRTSGLFRVRVLLRHLGAHTTEPLICYFVRQALTIPLHLPRLIRPPQPTTGTTSDGRFGLSFGLDPSTA